MHTALAVFMMRTAAERRRALNVQPFGGVCYFFIFFGYIKQIVGKRIEKLRFISGADGFYIDNKTVGILNAGRRFFVGLEITNGDKSKVYFASPFVLEEWNFGDNIEWVLQNSDRKMTIKKNQLHWDLPKVREILEIAAFPFGGGGQSREIDVVGMISAFQQGIIGGLEDLTDAPNLP